MVGVCLGDVGICSVRGLVWVYGCCALSNLLQRPKDASKRVQQVRHYTIHRQCGTLIRALQSLGEIVVAGLQRMHQAAWSYADTQSEG